MNSVAAPHTAPSSIAFTVLIPRPMQTAVEGLPTPVRQALLAELFRMASLAHEQRKALPQAGPYTLRIELAGCAATVELDATRARLTLAGVNRRGPQA